MPNNDEDNQMMTLEETESRETYFATGSGVYIVHRDGKFTEYSTPKREETE